MTSQRIGVELAGRMNQRADEAIARAVELGEHFWIALIAFRVTDPRGDLLLLDRENALYYPSVGCYICEMPYSDRLALRRCKGES